MNPSAEAPASAAATASSRRVMPQTLIIMAGSSWQQGPKRRYRIGGLHEMLTNQERMKAGGLEPLDVRARVDAAFRHLHDIQRHLFGQAQRGFERYLEGVQIAVIHADDLRAGIERGGELVF